jgi:hypothetical protein
MMAMGVFFYFITRSDNNNLILVLLQEAVLTMVDCNEGTQDCIKQQPAKYLRCITGVGNNLEAITWLMQ